MTDFEASDAIFEKPPGDQGDVDQSGGEAGCECETCVERSALVAEMAEETKKLQQCWLQLKQVKRTDDIQSDGHTYKDSHGWRGIAPQVGCKLYTPLFEAWVWSNG